MTNQIISRSARNMVEQLRMHARERGDVTALTVVGAEGETQVGYTQLDQLARALAAHLQARFEIGERALIMLGNDQHYLVAFFGCLYAGLIAVPVFAPDSARDQHMARLMAIAADASARCVLTSSEVIDLLGDAAAGFGEGAMIAVDAVDQREADRWKEHLPAGEDIAFLQYTSGSTSTPKGVMVSHANLIANELAIEQVMAVTAQDVFVTWLPLYHDMGLIGGALQPIFRGIPLVLMSPSYFLQRPLRWLDAISRHRGTISGGPDFAYRLCLERIKPAQAAQLDLSSWRLAFSGAEPVRYDTLQNFIEEFAPAGFAASAPYACYGLAEATLLVTGGARDGGITVHAFSQDGLSSGKAVPEPGGVKLVGCGAAAGGHGIRIVEPETLRPLADGCIGEILAYGPSIAQGYWQKESASATSFVEVDDVRCLCTNDLGFVHQGQLYIAGRIKDLIILRGQNIYPQDIEIAVENEVEAVRKGRVAAFSIDTNGGEGIGLAVEVSRGMQKLVAPAALFEAVSQSVAAACREPLGVLLLLNPGGLPKTSSGKLQRAACRQGWLGGTLDAYAVFEQGRLVKGQAPQDKAIVSEVPREGIEAELAALWRMVLGLSKDIQPSRQSHFFAGGGNSLAATRLAAQIEEQWQIDFPVRLLFEHPVLAECAEQISNRKAQGSPAREKTLPIVSLQRTGPQPLSYAQKRQWFLWQFDKASSAYHIGGALRFSGALDIDALRTAFLRLVSRHASLRTAFHFGPDGEAEQFVESAIQLDMRVVDLRMTGSQSRKERLAQELRTFHDEPFDLSRAGLLRVGLLKIDEHEHVLALVVHHIVADAWSMQVLVDELAACYRAQVTGHVDDLPLLPISYLDYAVWQRDYLDAGERRRQLAYWREQLGDEHPVLSLPTDAPRRATGNYSAARLYFALPQDLKKELEKLALERRTTLFTVLLAAFQALLRRQVSQDDIRVGVPVANRGRAEIAGVVGFFVNTQVLRSVINPASTLSRILEQTREAALGAQAHQDLPFEELVDALQPERDPMHHPLFQVLFNHLREDFRALANLPGLALEPYPLEQHGLQFELTLDTVERTDGSVHATFSYAVELFQATTIERLADQFVILLRHFVNSPDAALGSIDLLDDVVTMALLAQGSNEPSLDGIAPAHLRFARHAANLPDAVALLCGDASISYGELNERANRLAHHLVSLGAGPESRIGVALERSIDMVVGILAILKAGAAYVPLDPNYPAERLLTMIEDSGIAILLSHSWLEASLPQRSGMRHVVLDRTDLTDMSRHDPTPALRGNHLAYVIYTSGSTGKPKGVGISHEALARHTEVSIGFFGLSRADRMLQFATLNFDGFIEQLFPPLAAGASVVLRGADLWDSTTFRREIAAKAVTVVDLTTAYWFLLVQDFARQPEAGYGVLRQVHAGGEALPPEGLKAWREAGMGHITLLNTYGPTEAAVTATVLDCGPYVKEQLSLPSQMPIGRALAGRRLYVLDGELALAAPGAAGELCIGGELLARGYLNRVALTAERFVADPFGVPGSRLYRTGDLVRWQNDGQLQYLGRIDQQVKLRGQRVELGEIEACLLAQKGVREAAVGTRQGPTGMQLVAHVGTDVGADLDGQVLRRALKQTLPDYMVPSAIAVMGTLPKNPNGKIDRKALPEVLLQAVNGEAEAPRGEAEQALAALWCEVLGVETVGRDDNFFAIGGHSLAAIRVCALLSQHHACELPVRHFFDTGSLAELAAVVAAMGFGDEAKTNRLAEMDRLLSEFEV